MKELPELKPVLLVNGESLPDRVIRVLHGELRGPFAVA